MTWEARRIGRGMWFIFDGERIVCSLHVPWDGDHERLEKEARLLARAMQLEVACLELMAAMESACRFLSGTMTESEADTMRLAGIMDRGEAAIARGKEATS